HAVERGVDPLVLVRIERLVGLHIFVALTIAIGVENDRRPALRLHLVAGLFVHLRVEPAHNAALRPALAEPQRAVRIMAEIKVMGREAGSDGDPLAGLWIVHRKLAYRFIERERLCGRMVRTLLAEGWILRGADPGREPRPGLLIQDYVMNAGMAVPD